MKRILWLSRHKPCPNQIRALRKIFGYVKVIHDPRSFGNADDIVKRFVKGKFDDIVIVAPLSVIKQCIERGIKPLWAEMQICPPHSADVFYNGRYYKFIRFRRIVAIDIKYEDLLT
jgi:hypothetical protein